MPEVKAAIDCYCLPIVFQMENLGCNFVCLLQGEGAWRALLGDVVNDLEILHKELLKTSFVYTSLNCLLK